MAVSSLKKTLFASALIGYLVGVPLTALAQSGIASVYAYDGGRTASGERASPSALTAAHRTLPFGTLVRVTYQGRSVVVRINDRGPFVKGRDLDLSEGAARRIGLPGVGRVTIEVIRPSDIYIPKHGDWGVF